jgi:hypothetical protein
MHTELRLDEDGVLKTQIIVEDDTEISRLKWQNAILPAVGMLRWMGGGIMYVPHDPDDLAS